MLILVPIFILILSSCFIETNIHRKKSNFYYGDTKSIGYMYSYKVDETKDVPYIGIEDILNFLLDDFDETKGENTQTFTRNGVKIIADGNNNTIYFENYDKFFLGDNIGFNFIKPDKSIDSKSTLTNNNEVTIDYSKYNLKIENYNGKMIAPFHPTWALFNLYNEIHKNVNFNGNDYYVITNALLYERFGSSIYLTEYGSKYYSGSLVNNIKSDEYATAMMLDLIYGVREKRNLNFLDYLDDEHGKVYLSSPNPEYSANQLGYILSTDIDDFHTSYLCNGLFETLSTKLINGRNYDTDKKTARRNCESELKRIKTSYEFINGTISWLRKRDNICYIYFDSFKKDSSLDFYKRSPLPSDVNNDSFAMMYTAMNSIKSYNEDSRNVTKIDKIVIDLSTNGGGSAEALINVLGFINGKAHISLREALTGAYKDIYYNVDTNLDQVYDENDGYNSLYKFYVISSPLSYSSANALINSVKMDKSATVIGKKSGGGACVVYQTVFPSGDLVNISGNMVLGSYNNENQFIDIDDGVEVDYEFPDYSYYFDSEKINNFINSIPE